MNSFKKLVNGFNRKSKTKAKLEELITNYNELTCLIWDNALMKDREGFTDERRDVKETSKHWDKYHKITNKLDKTVRDLRGLYNV